LAALALRRPAQLHAALALEHFAGGVGQLQRAVFGHVDMDQPGRRQLAENALPGMVVEVAADTEGGQLVMVPLLDLVGRLAAQDVGQVRDAEAHAGAENGRQRFLRRLRAVPQFRRFGTDVAVAAGLAFFAEVVEQHLAAAARRFAVGEQGGQALCFENLLALAGAGFGDARVLQRDVLHAVGHPGFGRLAIAAGAAGFLVVGFDALRQVEVGDEADIRLVDAHAEGDGGAHDQAFLAQEAALVGGALRRRQAGVVGQRRVALG
jgi:hypothetical protein